MNHNYAKVLFQNIEEYKQIYLIKSNIIKDKRIINPKFQAHNVTLASGYPNELFSLSLFSQGTYEELGKGLAKSFTLLSS